MRKNKKIVCEDSFVPWMVSGKKADAVHQRRLGGVVMVVAKRKERVTIFLPTFFPTRSSQPAGCRCLSAPRLKYRSKQDSMPRTAALIFPMVAADEGSMHKRAEQPFFDHACRM